MARLRWRQSPRLLAPLGGARGGRVSPPSHRGRCMCARIAVLAEGSTYGGHRSDRHRLGHARRARHRDVPGRRGRWIPAAITSPPARPTGASWPSM